MQTVSSKAIIVDIFGVEADDLLRRGIVVRRIANNHNP